MIKNKIIHYVWFGENEKPENVKKCIKSWKKHTDKSWKIMEWNEKNVDIDSHPFLKYHFERKNWAFISDYLRALKIVEYGGFYFDTDIEMTRPITELLKHDSIFSRNSVSWLTASVIGGNKNDEILRYYLKIFDNDWIIKNQPTSGEQLAYSLRRKFKYDYFGKNDFKDGIALYDEKYLQYKIDESNFLIHHHDGSWFESRDEENAKKRIEAKIKTRSNPKLLKKQKKILVKKFKKFDKVLGNKKEW